MLTRQPDGTFALEPGGGGGGGISDPELLAIAGLASAAGKAIRFTGSGTAETFDLTDAAKTLLDDSTMDAMVTTLGGVTYTGTGGIVRRVAAVMTGGFTVLDSTFFSDSYGFPSQQRLRRANGTQGSPTQVLAGQEVGILGAQGYQSGGSFGAYNCYISYRAAEDLSPSGQGGYFLFFTTPIGSTTPANRFWVGSTGNIGIGVTAEPTTKLDVNGDMIRLRTAKTPASSGAAGNAGEYCWDTTYFYICTATNTWQRIPLWNFTGIFLPARGVHWSTELTQTPGATTATLPLNDANHQSLTLTAATGAVTATLTVPTANCAAGTIIVRQHATTARGITWAVSSGSIKWLGTQPTWSSDAVSSYRVVSWRWNGSIMFLTASDAVT